MDLKWFLFSFNGRVSRKQYWSWQLVVVCMFVLLISLVGGMENFRHSKFETMFLLINFWPGLAIQTKRWHDRNKSAWWVLINLVPLIGQIWAIVENGFLAGTAGENNYGEDPLSNE